MERREFLKLTVGFTAAAGAIAATAVAAQAAPMLPTGEAPPAPAQMSAQTAAEVERKGAGDGAEHEISSRRYWRRRRWYRPRWRRRRW